MSQRITLGRQGWVVKVFTMVEKQGPKKQKNLSIGIALVALGLGALVLGCLNYINPFWSHLGALLVVMGTIIILKATWNK